MRWVAEITMPPDAPAARAVGTPDVLGDPLAYAAAVQEVNTRG